MLVYKINESCGFFHDQSFENAKPNLPSSILYLILWKLHISCQTSDYSILLQIIPRLNKYYISIAKIRLSWSCDSILYITNTNTDTVYS